MSVLKQRVASRSSLDKRPLGDSTHWYANNNYLYSSHASDYNPMSISTECEVLKPTLIDYHTSQSLATLPKLSSLAQSTQFMRSASSKKAQCNSFLTQKTPLASRFEILLATNKSHSIQTQSKHLQNMTPIIKQVGLLGRSLWTSTEANITLARSYKANLEEQLREAMKKSDNMSERMGMLRAEVEGKLMERAEMVASREYFDEIIDDFRLKYPLDSQVQMDRIKFEDQVARREEQTSLRDSLLERIATISANLDEIMCEFKAKYSQIVSYGFSATSLSNNFSELVREFLPPLHSSSRSYSSSSLSLKQPDQLTSNETQDNGTIDSSIEEGRELHQQVFTDQSSVCGEEKTDWVTKYEKQKIAHSDRLLQLQSWTEQEALLASNLNSSSRSSAGLRLQQFLISLCFLSVPEVNTIVSTFLDYERLVLTENEYLISESKKEKTSLQAIEEILRERQQLEWEVSEIDRQFEKETDFNEQQIQYRGTNGFPVSQRIDAKLLDSFRIILKKQAESNASISKNLEYVEAILFPELAKLEQEIVSQRLNVSRLKDQVNHADNDLLVAQNWQAANSNMIPINTINSDLSGALHPGLFFSSKKIDVGGEYDDEDQQVNEILQSGIKGMQDEANMISKSVLQIQSALSSQMKRSSSFAQSSSIPKRPSSFLDSMLTTNKVGVRESVRRIDQSPIAEEDSQFMASAKQQPLRESQDQTSSPPNRNCSESSSLSLSPLDRAPSAFSYEHYQRPILNEGNNFESRGSPDALGIMTHNNILGDHLTLEQYQSGCTQNNNNNSKLALTKQHLKKRGSLDFTYVDAYQQKILYTKEAMLKSKRTEEKSLNSRRSQSSISNHQSQGQQSSCTDCLLSATVSEIQEIPEGSRRNSHEKSSVSLMRYHQMAEALSNRSELSQLQDLFQSENPLSMNSSKVQTATSLIPNRAATKEISSQQQQQQLSQPYQTEKQLVFQYQSQNNKNVQQSKQACQQLDNRLISSKIDAALKLLRKKSHDSSRGTQQATVSTTDLFKKPIQIKSTISMHVQDAKKRVNAQSMLRIQLPTEKLDIIEKIQPLIEGCLVYRITSVSGGGGNTTTSQSMHNVSASQLRMASLNSQMSKVELRLHQSGVVPRIDESIRIDAITRINIPEKTLELIRFQKHFNIIPNSSSESSTNSSGVATREKSRSSLHIGSQSSSSSSSTRVGMHNNFNENIFNKQKQSTALHLLDNLNLQSTEQNKKMQKIIETHFYAFTIIMEHSTRIELVAEGYHQYQRLVSAFKAIVENKRILNCIKPRISSFHEQI